MQRKPIDVRFRDYPVDQVLEYLVFTLGWLSRYQDMEVRRVGIHSGDVLFTLIDEHYAPAKLNSLLIDFYRIIGEEHRQGIRRNLTEMIRTWEYCRDQGQEQTHADDIITRLRDTLRFLEEELPAEEENV